jgi:hypothetical protein
VAPAIEERSGIARIPLPKERPGHFLDDMETAQNLEVMWRKAWQKWKSYRDAADGPLASAPAEGDAV